MIGISVTTGVSDSGTVINLLIVFLIADSVLSSAKLTFTEFFTKKNELITENLNNDGPTTELKGTHGMIFSKTFQ